MIRVFAIVFALAFLCAAQSMAEVPKLLSYQGVLTDGSGVAVPDNTYSITFALYTTQSGGSAIWTETDNVQVTKGVFSATLGTQTMLSTLKFDTTYYIGMSVGGGPELPRQILTATPYSLNSEAVVGTANVFPSSGNVGIGTTTPTGPLEIKFDNLDAAKPAIAINNSTPGGQDVIDFKYNGTSYSRIRHAQGGGLMIGTLVGSELDLLTNDITRLTVAPAGNVGIGSPSPAEKLDVTGGVRIGNSSNSNAGTLRWTGTDFEGYNGSAWKSLTGGSGGNLPTGSAGQTLRNNGSNWVATSNLYNDGTSIGIGTTAPTANLHVAESGPSEARLETSNNNMDAALELKTANGPYDYLRFVKIGATSSGNINGIPLANLGLIYTGATGGPMMLDVMTANPMYFLSNNLERMRLTPEGRLGINTTNPTALLQVAGNVKIGTPTADGYLQMFMNGSTNPVVTATFYAHGGAFYTYDEAGNITVADEPDFDGEGGYFAVNKDASLAGGFYVDGNYSGTKQPAVSLVGDTRYAFFNMSATGDGSVQLPNDAISASEILDEPGVASWSNGTTGQALTASTTAFASQSIVAPAAGYALVIGTVNLAIGHTNGVASHAVIGVSGSPSVFPSNQDVYIDLPAGAASGTYFLPATFHGLFQIGSAGTVSYYFIGFATSGSYAVFERQLSIVYLPTAYGTVQPTLAAAAGESSGDKLAMRAGAPLSSADIAAQQTASEAANAARVQKELDEMKARLATIEQHLRNR